MSNLIQFIQGLYLNGKLFDLQKTHPGGLPRITSNLIYYHGIISDLCNGTIFSSQNLLISYLLKAMKCFVICET